MSAAGDDCRLHRVEGRLQGPAEAAARMQAWLSDGPRAARVDGVPVTTLALPVVSRKSFERRTTE